MDAALENTKTTDDQQPQEIELQSSDEENGLHKRQRVTQVSYFHQRLHEMIAEDLRNFDSWSSLIEEIERIFPFVDLCWTVQDVTKARVRHVQLFPQSVRKNAGNKQPGSENCISNVKFEQREKVSHVFPNFQDKTENLGQNSETNLAVSDVNELTSDRMLLHQIDNTAAEVESGITLQQVPEVDVAGLTTTALVHVSSDDKSVSKDKIHTFHDHSTELAVSEPPQKDFISVDNHDRELQQHQIPISSHNFLHTVERSSSNLAVVGSDQLDASLNVSKSICCKPHNLQNSETIHPSSSLNSVPAVDSVQAQEYSVGTGSASFSSSASRPKRTAADMHSECLVTPSYAGDHHQMHIGTTTETSVVDISAKSQHQHQVCSMSEQDPNTKGSHMPMSQADRQPPSFQEQVGHSQVQNKEGTVKENKSTGPVSNVSSPSACQSYGPQTQYTALQGTQSLSQGWQYPQHLMQQQYQQQYQLYQQYQEQQTYPWKQQQLPHQQFQTQQPAHEQYYQLQNLDHEMKQQGYLQNATPAYLTSVQQYQIHQQLPHQTYQYQYNLVQQAHQTGQRLHAYYGVEQQNQPQMSNGDPQQGSAQQLQGKRSTSEGSERSRPSVSLCKQQTCDGSSPSYDMET